MRYSLSAGILLQLLIVGGSLQAQTKTLVEGQHRIEITLEKRDAQEWRSVNPSLVFEKDDLVRFRIRTNFDGYLYVMNHATSGGYSLLFPQQQGENDNGIRANKEYVIPGADGQFQITGPPGHEIIYWLISPVPLASIGAKTEEGSINRFSLPKASKPVQNLLPRCNDEIFRARGECIDDSAGPGRISGNGELPDSLTGHAGPASRDLTFTPQDDSVVISSAVPLSDPIIYEFRLAHR